MMRNAGNSLSVSDELSPVQREILKEMSKTFIMLGANSGIMNMIGSWGDTLPQEEVLQMWRDWNHSAKEKDWIVKPAVMV